MTRKEIERLNRWTKYKKYYAGENHYQWEVKLVIYQRNSFFKFVMSGDEDTIYIATNYVAPATADKLDETINEIMYKSERYESLTDIYDTLQDTFYGQLFYCGAKIAPQLTDGILLLSLNGNNDWEEIKCEQERIVTIMTTDPRYMSRKKYLREKKKLKRILRKTALLKENKAYKKAWLLKHQTAIYNHDFHPAWGEPLTITHGYHGFKKTEEVVPLFLEVGDDTYTLPFKEHKIIKNLMPLMISGTRFAVSNTAPLEGEDI